MSGSEDEKEESLESAFSTAAHSLLDKIPSGSLPATVKKELVYPGSASSEIVPPYPAGSRLRFHFETRKTQNGKVFDDSRTHPKPMELIIGKKFKVEIWELALNTMMLKEVAKFIVPRPMCVLYPMVAKVLRDSFKGGDSHKSKSCCGSMLNGTGHSDLDELLKMPESLTFTFELLEVALPGDYEMESWYMTDDQKIESITTLQEDGNKLFGQKRYKDASDKYFEAISRIEQLLNKEVPGSQEMKEMQMRKVPLLLNYAFCKQKEEQFYESMIHINSVIELDPDNVKGFFRRAQCHKHTGSFDLARKDLSRALELDSSLQNAVRLELEDIAVLQQKSEFMERQRYQRMFNNN